MSTHKSNGPSNNIDLDKDKSVKSMENPISAIFDLSESVNSQVPRIRKMIQYTGIFVTFSLVVNFILMVLFMAVGQLPLCLIVLVFLIVGLFGLYLMWNINKFFAYFSTRHLAIRLLRDTDTLVYVPKGRTTIQSYLTHLTKANPNLDMEIRSHPNMVHLPALLTGASGISYHFDGYLFKPSSSFWRLFGTGEAGYAFFIKAFDHSPTLGEVQAMEKAVQDVSAKTGVMPSRIVALVEKKAGAKIEEDVYEHVTTKRPIIIVGRQTCVVNLQIVSVDEDNTYDFVPLIAESGGELP